MDKVNAGLNELDQLEGFFGDEYDDEDEEYGGYDDEDEDEYDYDYYEGLENDTATAPIEGEEGEEDIDDTMAEIEKELASMDAEKEEEEGFGNMFNLDFSKNCMVLIVIVLILILCKEDIMKMDFFKKLFK